MTWDKKKPWTAPARSLVLLRRDSRWRFAIYNEAGIVDGALDDVPVDAAPEAAQARLVDKVVELTGLKYEVQWSSGELDTWAAEVVPSARGRG